MKTNKKTMFSQGWWLDKKNALEHVWAAKNPFNDKYDRELHRSGLRLFHPDNRLGMMLLHDEIQ